MLLFIVSAIIVTSALWTKGSYSEVQFKSESDGDGTCRWSGMAPGCGIGTCPGTDWYAIGNSSIDENGNECADGINNLYCCPKVRKPRPFRVKICTGTDLQGVCADVQNDTMGECADLPEILGEKTNSADTYGGCVRLYDSYGCSGHSTALHTGNSENHMDLSKFNFANQIGSVGPCLRNDFCAPQNACRFPVEEFDVGCCAKNTVESRDTTGGGAGGPVRYYRLGYKKRTEYVFAVLEPIHLNTGTRPTFESLEHVRSLGLDTDVVGMLVPARLGGNGTDPRNLFPLTSDLNIQAVLRTHEDYIYDLIRSRFKKHTKVELRVILQYFAPKDTRPIQVVFRVLDSTDRSLLFQDSFGNLNPVFPRPQMFQKISFGNSTSTSSTAPTTRKTIITQQSGGIRTNANANSVVKSQNLAVDNTPGSENPSSNTFLYYILPSILVILAVVSVGAGVFVFRKWKLSKAKQTVPPVPVNDDQETEQMPLRMNRDGILEIETLLSTKELTEPEQLQRQKADDDTSFFVGPDNDQVHRCLSESEGNTTSTNSGLKSIPNDTNSNSPTDTSSRTPLSDGNIGAIAVKLASYKMVCKSWRFFLPDMGLTNWEADLTSSSSAANQSHRVFFLELLQMWRNVNEPEECTVQRLQAILVKYGCKGAAASLQKI